MVQNTTSENADDQQEEDQEMDEESFLTEETEEQEQENEDEEEEEETIHVTGMKKEQGRKVSACIVSLKVIKIKTFYFFSLPNMT